MDQFDPLLICRGKTNTNHLHLGIDVGSTTVKALVLDIRNNEVLFSRYERHHAEQVNTVRHLLLQVAEAFPGEAFRIAVCGSGGKPIAQAIGAHYIQEVVANASGVRKLYPQARTAIELGGQDAKLSFSITMRRPNGSLLRICA